jgi:hypothetical protein
MLNRPLEEIDAATIEQLIAEGVSESKTLDYKRDLPGKGEDAKKEFLADVTSFANASGGHILFGVAELVIDRKKTGKPGEVHGIDEEPDEAILRLEGILQNCVDPRLTPRAEFKAVEGVKGDKKVLVLRIPRSWSAPHMVKTHNSRFYSRTSAGKQALDAREIRLAFGLSEELPRRMQRFRDERLARIVANEGPVRLVDAPKVVLHLVPMASTDPLFQLEVPQMMEKTGKLMSVHFGQNASRANLDGFLLYDDSQGDRYLRYTDTSQSGGCHHYTQAFRSGAIEAVSTTILDPDRDNSPIPTALLERAIFEAVQTYLEFYLSFSVSPPCFLFVSLIDVQGHCLSVSGYSGRIPNKIDRDVLQIPEVTIDTFEGNPGNILRPVFDTIWQSAGFQDCPHYDADGNWST